MDSVFTKIIKGEIPCYKISESEKFIAFLDVMPLNHGHVLVVPKIEVDYIFELDDVILAEILLFAKPIALAIEKAIPCERIGLSIIGLEVPHAHLHLVPINNADDLNFTRPKLKIDSDEMENIANRIKSFL